MHTKFTQLMSLVLDKEASPDEAHCLQEHLRDCPACAQVWVRWQTLDRRLSAAPQVAPAVSLVSLVSARLAERELRRRRTWWVGSGLLLTWLLVFVVVLAGVVLASNWVTGRPQLVADLLSGLANFFSGAIWLLRAAARFLGAPRLAAGAGLFTMLTCGLAVMWLWLMERSHRSWASALVLAR